MDYYISMYCLNNLKMGGNQMIKVKKLISGILISLIMVSFIGCSSDSEANRPQGEAPLNITIIGASSSGTLFMVLSAISECINMTYPGSKVTIVPGSTGANPIRINNNEGDVSVSNSVQAYAAMHGNDPFTEEHSNIAAIAALYPSVLQIAFDKKIGIISLEEFLNKKMKLRISIGQPGSNTELMFKQILSEYGLTLDDISNWGGEIIYQNIDNSAQMLADGTIDGALFATLVPVPNLLEASTAKDFEFLSIDQKIIDKMIEKYKYQSATIPAGSYPSQQAEIQTIACTTFIFVPKDSSDENAYKIARSINENLDYLHDVHANLSGLTSEELVLNMNIPLHPGAEKYYREQGIINK